MADIRKRKGKKGTTYQVRYPSKSAATGYAFATFATLKEARAFTENLGSVKDRAGCMSMRVPDAVDRWLDICEKIGRDGRETVEAMTLKTINGVPRSSRNIAGPRNCTSWNQRTSFSSEAGSSKTKLGI
jgi:hypothetical protein